MKRPAMLGLQVLVEKVDDRFIAHCLELDIVAEGTDVDEVRYELEALIAEQLKFAMEHDNLENLYHPAPAEIWARFAHANSPTRTIPQWSQHLDASRTTPLLPLAIVTTHYSYAKRKAASAATT